jgi:hypothetical protein
MSLTHFVAGAVVTAITGAAIKFIKHYCSLKDISCAVPMSKELKEALKETIAEVEQITPPALPVEKKKIRAKPTLKIIPKKKKRT